MRSKSDFRKALRATLEEHITLEQPIFRALLSGAPNWQLLRMVATQGYHLTKHFLEYVETLFFYCPPGLHKKRLLFNLFEEETGYLSRTDNHVRLMERFIRAIGVSDGERDSTLALPATEELINYRMNLVKNPSSFHLGAAAVMIASEGQNLESVGGTARHEILRQHFNLREEDTIFFSVHQKEDVGHVREGIEVVCDVCSTEKMQLDALDVVNETCKRFRNMYDGAFEAYKANVSHAVMSITAGRLGI